MRIAIGQVWQESNTLNPVLTTQRDFEEFGVTSGEALVEAMQSTNELGGFIQSLRSWPEVPTVLGAARFPAWPSGPMTKEGYAWMRKAFEQTLRKILPVDGMLFALHGAMVAEGTPDTEGDLLQLARELLGPEIPLVATLDLHANITRQMSQNADALVLYHCMPHIDIFETGQRAAMLLRRMLVDGIRPAMSFVKIPAVVPAEHSNTEATSGVAADLKRRVLELESRPEVLAAGVAPVQPWLDIPELGSSVVVVSDGDEAISRQLCQELANEFWDRKREYLPPLHGIEESVRLAQSEAAGLVVLSDAADATTSGAPGDSVWLLEELLKHEWRGPVLVPVVDPELVERAAAEGVGATLDAQLGSKRDTRFGTTVTLSAEVESVFAARFVMSGHIGKNLAVEMGPAAVLACGPIRIFVTSRSGPHFAPEFFQSGGHDPFEAAVVVAKSPCGFRAVYEGKAAAIYSVRAPGCAPSDFWNQPFEQIDRPLWPWDEDLEWNAAVAAS